VLTPDAVEEATRRTFGLDDEATLGALVSSLVRR
jgi:hypothetical protein